MGCGKATEAVAGFFLQWASKLSPVDLGSVEVSDRLEALTEARPAEYLPILRGLLESASDEQLEALPAEGLSGRWGPRLHLVWLARNLAAFDEHFVDAEATLLRLATTESSENWRHNAADNWKNLYRLILSQTSRSFLKRVAILERRLMKGSSREAALALEALGGVVDNLMPGTKVGDSLPDVVGGRVIPPEWRPTSQQEHRDCYSAVLSLLHASTLHTDSSLRRSGQALLVQKAEMLLGNQELGFLQDTVADCDLHVAFLPKLLQATSTFLIRQQRYVSEDKKLPADYLADVRAWMAELIPSDLHGRVVSVVGRDAHFYTRAFLGDDEAGELAKLAEELHRDPKDFADELEWLLSPEALSASALGEALGKLDANATFLGTIFAECGRRGSAALGKGYASGLLRNHPEHKQAVVAALDSLDETAPEVAFELAVSAGGAVEPLKRTLTAVKAGKLSPARLVGFLHWVGDRRPTVAEFREVLQTIAASEELDEASTSWAVTLLAYRNLDDRKSGAVSVYEDKQVQEAAWTLLERAVSSERLGGESTYWLKDILRVLQELDPERAIVLAVGGLTSSGVRCSDACEGVLEQLAKSHPKLVMKHLGPAMLDPETAWRFHIDQYRGVFWSIDETTLKEWLLENGVPAARALARHLPSPAVDGEGKPVVPPLTEFVLTTFEEDDGVAAAFSAGVHGIEVGVGDISRRFEQRAERAKVFVNHPLRRVREWAQGEVASCEAEAKRFKRMEEERWLD